jgi:hypothetical protein
MKLKVIITIYEKYLDDLINISKLFIENGLSIEYIDDIGIIIGIVDKKDFEDLKKMKEIESIQEDYEIHLPIPSSDVQ